MQDSLIKTLDSGKVLPTQDTLEVLQKHFVKWLSPSHLTLHHVPHSRFYLYVHNVAGLSKERKLRQGVARDRNGLGGGGGGGHPIPSHPSQSCQVSRIRRDSHTLDNTLTLSRLTCRNEVKSHT